ncbi:MAG: MarR family winged helix-turn-helix transcriptional regulator [Candidatus Cyclobacteriaceae bacterium M3_2C_046]
MDNSEILADIRKIVHAVNQESKQIEKEFGISIPQLLCIQHLNKSEDFRLTHKDISQKLSLNSSTVTGIIDRLEKKGLVARLPKKGDKRVTFISLTSRGEELIKSAPDLLHSRLLKKLKQASSSELEVVKNGLLILTQYLGLNNMSDPPIIFAETQTD